MSYEIRIAKSATKQLDKISAKTRDKIEQTIDALADIPRPNGCKKLQPKGDRRYRIRVGDYRIIYQVRDEELLILVLSVGHRQGVY